MTHRISPIFCNYITIMSYSSSDLWKIMIFFLVKPFTTIRHKKKTSRNHILLVLFFFKCAKNREIFSQNHSPQFVYFSSIYNKKSYPCTDIRKIIIFPQKLSLHFTYFSSIFDNKGVLSVYRYVKNHNFFQKPFAICLFFVHIQHNKILSVYRCATKILNFYPEIFVTIRLFFVHI
jgi:hypothetical protein